MGRDTREQRRGRIPQGLMGHDEVSGFYSTQIPRWDTVCPEIVKVGPRLEGPWSLWWGRGASLIEGPLAPPSTGQEGTLKVAPRSPSSPLPAICSVTALSIFSAVDHFLFSSAPAKKMQSRAVTGPLITAERAPRSWDRKTGGPPNYQLSQPLAGAAGAGRASPYRAPRPRLPDPKPRSGP